MPVWILKQENHMASLYSFSAETMIAQAGLKVNKFASVPPRIAIFLQDSQMLQQDLAAEQDEDNSARKFRL